MEPTCPECGGHSIWQWNRTWTRYPVEDIIEHPKGLGREINYGVAEVEWETSEPQNLGIEQEGSAFFTYWCKSCSFSSDDLESFIKTD
jgi:hypothetical protein